MNIRKITLYMVLFVAFFAGAVQVQANTSGKTKHPIVLVHGLSGFDTLLGDYFYGIRSALTSVGANEVYTPQISGYENNEVRGEELLAYIEDLLATTGAAKVNLIGHSQGGTTARYVASVRPDLVASVTSVGTPHFGSEVADALKDSPLEGPALAIGNAIGALVATLSGDSEQEVRAAGALEALTSEGAALFNAAHPQGVRTGACQVTPYVNKGSWWWPNWVADYSVNNGAKRVNGVRYYSWSGIYQPLWDSNVLDLADGLLSITWWMSSEDNDGVVGRCSTHLGKVIRDDYTLNHTDQINGMFGLRGLWSSDPVQVYVDHARRLKKRGM